MIKFISYDGEWPNLCRGTLTLEFNDKKYELKYILQSGGCCGFYNDYAESYIDHGPWGIDEYELPEELKPYADEIRDLVNENVPEGCCGGCL